MTEVDLSIDMGTKLKDTSIKFDKNPMATSMMCSSQAAVHKFPVLGAPKPGSGLDAGRVGGASKCASKTSYRLPTDSPSNIAERFS